MLKEIARAWRSGGLMKDVIRELAEMVADAEYVYSKAWEACLGLVDLQEMEQPLRERDKQINSRERHIRRMLLEHATLNPGRDISGCLAVMTMGKDAERMGDLSKDIFRLSMRLNGSVRELKYFSRLEEIQQSILQEFPLLQQAVRKSDDEAVDALFEHYQQVKPMIKDLLDEVLSDELSTLEAGVPPAAWRFHWKT